MERRFGDAARIIYHDVADPEVRASRGTLLDEIEIKGLLFPVTVVDGAPIYDGAVSYPGVLRAIHDRLARSTA